MYSVSVQQKTFSEKIQKFIFTILLGLLDTAPGALPLTFYEVNRWYNGIQAKTNLRNSDTLRISDNKSNRWTSQQSLATDGISPQNSKVDSLAIDNIEYSVDDEFGSKMSFTDRASNFQDSSYNISRFGLSPADSAVRSKKLLDI